MGDSVRFLCSSSRPGAAGCVPGPDSECMAYSLAKQTLQKCYKFTSFRSGQLEALLPVLHGKDTFCSKGNWCWEVFANFPGPSEPCGQSGCCCH